MSHFPDNFNYSTITKDGIIYSVKCREFLPFVAGSEKFMICNKPWALYIYALLGKLNGPIL